MDERQRQLWSRAKLWTCNAFIALLLIVILIEGFPFSAPRMREIVNPFSKSLGIYQWEWNMFAPEPDVVNTRLSAEIEYYDGTVVNWSTPEWRKLSYFQRFMQFRDHEYLEKMGDLTFSKHWPRFADYLVREHGDPQAQSEVKVVRIFTQMAEIPEPFPPPETEEEAMMGAWATAKWQTWKEPPPFGERSPLYERKYP